MGGRGTLQSLVGMPDAVAIAIIDESLVKLHPAVIATQEIETRHRLQPRQGERYVRIDGVTMGKNVAHDQMRLRDHFLPEQLDDLLTRQGLSDPVVDPLDLAEMLVTEDRHAREHSQRGDRGWSRIRKQDGEK